MATHEVIRDQLVFTGSNKSRIAMIGTGLAQNLRMLEATVNGVVLKATHTGRSMTANQLIGLAEAFVDEGNGPVEMTAEAVEEWL